MRTKAVRMLIIAGLLTLSGRVYADIDLEKGTTLTKQEFVKDALTKDPEFVTALQQYLQSKYSALSTMEIAEWTLNASATLNHSEATYVSSSTSDTDSIGYAVGVEKLFFNSGTRLSIAHENTMAQAKSTMTSATSDSSTPGLTLAITQPLLQNAFGLSDRYPVVVAELQKKSAYHDAMEAWEGRIADLEKAYLDWCQAYENVKAYQTITQELVKLENSVRRKYRAGVSDEKDLVQTEQTLLQNQSSLIQAETTYLNETLNIAILKAGQSGIDEKALEIRPDFSVQPMQEIKAVNDNELNNLRLIQKLVLLKEQQQYAKKVADNEAMPILDLTGSYTIKGREADQGGGYSAISDHNDYTVMLEASYPLGGTKAKGDQGEADAALKEIEATMTGTGQSMSLSIKQMNANIDMMEKTLAIQGKLVKKSERELALDKKDYNIGRLDIYYLIDTQNSLTTSRLSYIKNKIQLDQLKLDYLALTDQLLGQYPDLVKQMETEK